MTRRTLAATTLGLTSLAASSFAFGQTAPSSDGQIETVNVTARKSALDKIPDEIKNTPQTIDVVPLQVMQEQGTQSLEDVLRNVPGITLNAGEGGSHGDAVNLRGFSASDDFFLDGLRDTGFYDRDPFNLESVEVYKGPASTLFGRGSTGGVINQVTKQPQLYPIDEAVLTAGSDNLLRATGDVNYVINDSDAFRIDAMGDHANVAERDFVLNQRWGIAPSIAFGLGEKTTLTLSYFHQYENNLPDYGIPFLFGKVAPVPRTNYYGLVNDDRTLTQVDIGTAHLTHDFGNGLSAQDTFRYGSYWFDFRVTAPHYGGDPGEPPFPVPGQPLDTIAVLRDQPSTIGAQTTLMNASDLTYKFATGDFAHTLVVGVEYDRETDDITEIANPLDDDPENAIPTQLLHPDPFQDFGHSSGADARPSTTANTVGVYAVDTIEFGPNWSAVAALRYDHFSVHYSDQVSGFGYSHTDNIPSPRVALLYKPTDTQTFYVSYGTSFNPSAENLSLAPQSASLSPEKDQTFELGAKTQWLDGLLGLTGALFDTEMLNARFGDPDDPLLQLIVGKERVLGFELGATGHLTDNLEIQAGYTYLDPRIISSTDPTQYGRMLPDTAHNQATLWLVYDSDQGWQLGGGLNYLGERFADPQNTASVPGYVTFDAMAGYRISDHISLQINAYNLANTLYYTGLYWSGEDENHAIPGTGRTLTVTAKLDL